MAPSPKRARTTPFRGILMVGLGAMGRGLAGHLPGLCSRLFLRDTNAAAATALAGALKATVVDSVEVALAEKVDVVVTCLPTSAEVADLVKKAGNFLEAGGLWVDCTSGDPQASRAIAASLKDEHGVEFVDAAMSGGMAGAAAGTLTVMVGGTDAGLERAQPLVKAFSKTIHLCGGVGSGHAIKAVNNMVMASNLLAAGEGLVVLQKNGISAKLANEVINTSSGRSWATQQRIPDHVLPGTYDYGFRTCLLNKDIRTALSMAASIGVVAPHFVSTANAYAQLEKDAGPDVDHTTIVKQLEEAVGVRLGDDPGPISTRTPSVSAMGIKLAVFDMAGTTVNEGAIVYKSLVKAINSFGCSISEDSDEFAQWHGANKIECIRWALLQKHGETVNGYAAAKRTDHDAEIEKCYALFQSLLKEEYFTDDSPICPIEGAIELMDALREKGVKVCLNTGYPRELADGLIAKLGFGPHIDGSIVSEEVGQGRPYPYMVHALMRRFNVERTSQVMKVGDTVRDIEEGRYAGCGVVVGVLTGADDLAHLVAAHPHLVLPSVASITP